MKFIHYLEKISGVSIYALSSLLLFGLVFLVMTIWALKADKHMIEEIRKIPLDGAVKVLIVFGIFLLPCIGARAEGPKAAEETSSPFVAIMLIIIAVLGLAIALLANVLLGAAQMPFSRPEQTPDNTAAHASPGASAGQHTTDRNERYAGIAPSGAAGAFLPLTAMIPGVSDTAFYLITGVIVLEVIILFALLYNVKLILSLHKKAKAPAGAETLPARPRISWWAKINRFKPIEQEVSLDLGHDYDGIRELDNRLPPWWLYGFYCTIIFAGIYLWRYHIAHSAPLSREELQIALQQAEIQKAEYLKKAANNVDETTVRLLTDPADLAAGKAIFESTCFACHGREGQGGVGPNLTDDYWLHGGSIQEVFKTIKYGWPDKGMKSWKDDFSPSKIAQIASYVKSLQGTHPANPKAPQGALAK